MSGERVLVVHDEPSVLRLCTEALAGEGFQVQGAAANQEALSRLKRERFGR